MESTKVGAYGVAAARNIMDQRNDKEILKNDLATRQYHVGLLLFVLVACIFACDNVDKAKFDQAYRAAKAIEGAASVNVTFNQFRELLQSYSTEVTILKDKINTKNEKEQRIFKLHQNALQAYSDSMTLWQEKIETSFVVVTCEEDQCKRYRNYGITILESTDEDEAEVSAKKLGITVRTPEPLYIVKDPDVAIQQAWTYAEEKVSEANRIVSE